MGQDSDFSDLEFKTTSIDRRVLDNESLSNILQEMFQEVKHMRKELNQHIEDETKLIIRGFPEEDLDAHRMGHELQNKLLTEKADFWAKLRISVTSWGMIGVLGFIAVTVWKAFILGPAVK